MPSQTGKRVVGSDLYLSPHWTGLRYLAWKRADGHCERCDVVLVTGGWHLHHLTYERAGAELLSDVEAICVPCHQAEHPEKVILDAAGIQKEQRKRLHAKRRTVKRDKPKLKHGPGRKGCRNCGGLYSRKRHRLICVQRGLC